MNSVNTNLGALIAQRNMESVENKMQKAMERLSSGLRINNAADDAADDVDVLDPPKPRPKTRAERRAARLSPPRSSSSLSRPARPPS